MPLENSLSQRSNADWVRALRGRDQGSVAPVRELQDYIHRSLRKILRRHPNLGESDFYDLTQEVMLKLVEYLHTFRGDSAFTTWATSVATRVAFTELRKRRVRDRGAREYEMLHRDAVEAPSAEDVALKQDLLSALSQAIENELTDRQKIAILGELRGIPTIELAKQLDTNQNALYKLVHDGRKRLRTALSSAGYTPELVKEFVVGASTL